MKKQFILLLVALLGFTFQALSQNYISPSGKIVSKDYSVDNFTGIDISTDFKAFVTIANKTEVRIETDDNLQQYIMVNVANEVLEVRHSSKVGIRGKETLVVHITVPSLKYIKGSSDAIIQLKTPLETEELRVELSGDSTLDGVVSAKKLDTQLKGDSYLTLSGQVDLLKADVAGDSEIKDFDFVVKNLELKLRGDSVAELTIEESMQVNLNGDSEMKYKGNPQVVMQSVHGDSEIRKVN